MGSAMPFSHWMRDGLRDAVATTLLDKDLGGQIAVALDHQAVTAVWSDFLKDELDGRARGRYIRCQDLGRHLPHTQ